MERLPAELQSHGKAPGPTDSGPSETDEILSVSDLLAAHNGRLSLPPDGVRAGLLAGVMFGAVVTVIEEARPGATAMAEAGLLRDWIAANPKPTPHHVAAWFNLGVTLSRAGDQPAAALAYRKASELNPGFHPAAVNLGLVFEGAGQPDAALRVWENALQPDDARTALLNHKGRLLESLGRLDDAETALRASLLTSPGQADATQHWVHLRQKMCRWPALMPLPGLCPSSLAHYAGPLGILALSDDVGLQRDVTGAWIARKMPAASERISPPDGYRHDRLRIGYLSSDFCRHAMSYLITELFERHDRNRFEIFGYCATLDDGSEIRQRVVAAFDHFRSVRALGDEAAARLIRADEIDILIDLNGLTARTRLAVLRWRPAPVQATYLGFVGPVPLPELDYVFCDDFVIPPAAAPGYCPTPLAVARLYQANDSKRAIAGPLTRREAGLPEDRFVFCCFSNHYKITEALFAGWIDILHRAPGAILWLAADNAWSQAALREAAARGGVCPERILFADRTSPELYLRRLGLADLFLDTFPYNAGTVASDAIRVQVPLLTLSGRSFASRMAGSLLTAIGAADGIATSLEDYVQKASLFANDAQAYAGYRRHFTAESWERSLGDIDGFTAQFESTLTRIARRGLAA